MCIQTVLIVPVILGPPAVPVLVKEKGNIVSWSTNSVKILPVIFYIFEVVKEIDGWTIVEVLGPRNLMLISQDYQLVRNIALE